MISCLARLVTMVETRLYDYDPLTKQQSMERRKSGSPPPKKIRVQKTAGKFLASIFWDKTETSSLITFQSAKLSMRIIIHFCWCNWRTFWRKIPAGSSPRFSLSCMTMPRLTGHLQPTRNWPTLAPNFLITHPILPISPSDCHLFPGMKYNWKVTIFRPTGRSLLPRRPGWTDNLLNFFLNGLLKLEQRAKKFIELWGSILNKSQV